MTRRGYNRGVYKLTTDKSNYAVLIERKHNSVYGEPRYKCEIINLNEFYNNYGCAVTYTTGGYGNELQIAEKIVKIHEAKSNK